jgi:uncharacterized membrane protein
LDCLDWLRGLVMVLMVLDHTRHFFSSDALNPRDPNSPMVFLTRWVTHFCAPAFVFLAGVSAYLFGARGRTRAELSRFLATRGLWLVFLELTLVRLGLTFDLRYNLIILQVIWTIGIALVVLSGLIYLPPKIIVAIGLAMVVGHDLFDGFKAEQAGAARWLWMLLHQQGYLTLSKSVTVYVVYPLVPWIGVAALGYAFGPVMQREPAPRRAACLRFGLVLTAVFVLLRATNVYGDPQPWTPQSTALGTVLSFVNCEKYPPSLLFLCMTLSAAMLLLAVAPDSDRGRSRFLVTFGRVPFFFYVAHIFLLHCLAVMGRLAYAIWVSRGIPPGLHPPPARLGLPATYLLWVLAVAALYPFCRRFAEIKQTHKNWWLSYL